MPQQDARKYYISLVNDTAENERLAGGPAPSQPRVMSYLVGRLAAVLKRSAEAAPGRSITS
ncbi:hypothetical protein [Bradyrhizobium sp. USDA 4486]